MSYSVKVLDHYENPRNVGSFGKEDEGVATGMVGVWGRVTKAEAPNSPILMENAKTAPTRIDRLIMGISIRRHTW